MKNITGKGQIEDDQHLEHTLLKYKKTNCQRTRGCTNAKATESVPGRFAAEQDCSQTEWLIKLFRWPVHHPHSVHLGR